MQKIVSILSVLFLCMALQAQIEISSEDQYGVFNMKGKKNYYSTWTWRTTDIVPKKELHAGIIAASRYALNENLEISTHLIALPFAPNIALKKRWKKSERWSYASRHRIYYPRLGLNYFKNSGYKNILPDSVEIPQILAFQNEFMASLILNPSCDFGKPSTILTTRLGVDFAIKSGNSTLPRMTYFNLYHRSSVFHGDVLIYAGAQLDGNLFGKERLNFTVSSDYYRVNLGKNTAFEHIVQLHYFFNGKISVSAGVMFHQSKNKIEKDSNILPFVDFIYRFNHRILEKGLFK